MPFESRFNTDLDLVLHERQRDLGSENDEQLELWTGLQLRVGFVDDGPLMGPQPNIREQVHLTGLVWLTRYLDDELAGNFADWQPIPRRGRVWPGYPPPRGVSDGT